MTDASSQQTEIEKVSCVASSHFQEKMRSNLPPEVSLLARLSQPVQLTSLAGVGPKIWIVQILARGREIGTIAISESLRVLRFGIRVQNASEIEQLPLSVTELEADNVSKRVNDVSTGVSSTSRPILGYVGFASKIAWSQNLANGKRVFITPELEWIEDVEK
jgi:hypothetical protein